jgi:hypothetical protein
MFEGASATRRHLWGGGLAYCREIPPTAMLSNGIRGDNFIIASAIGV